jgi:hypothetical protein
MTEQPPTFDIFLREWTAERIVALGHRADPSDREFIVGRRAAELTSLAREGAFYVRLVEAVQPYGGIVEYVREMYRSAEARAGR